ncbi:hypothetical protein GYH30_013271 [Glycine max]|uniref:HVA22-like protein n=1 Tax=Glycine max TaxID=3847 RepID=A0A0R0K484_SOYBN|nr:hypothetical protein GYH30_013271 [Glycine max]
MFNALMSLVEALTTLLYPLYASVVAIEGPNRLDEKQWLAYWIIYSFFTLVEIVLQPLLEWIPFWCDVKLYLVLWLILPHFKGAAFLYERFVTTRSDVHIGESELINLEKFI